MLRISKLADYGTLLLAEMSREPDRICSAADLAQRVHIGEATASKLLKQLLAGGLVRSFRGNAGGYQLSRPPEDISLARVLTLLEGSLAVTECSLAPGVCRLEEGCAVRSHWQQINRAIYRGLDELTVADLARPLQPEQRVFRL